MTGTSLVVALVVRGKELFIAVTDDQETIELPLTITAETPITRKPLLAKMDVGDIPQIIIDTLMLEHYKYSAEELWWREYYLIRQEDQVKYADEIAKNDREFYAAAHPESPRYPGV
jgi:hypothetical protein